MTQDCLPSNSVISLAHDMAQDIVFQRICFRTVSKRQEDAPLLFLAWRDRRHKRRHNHPVERTAHSARFFALS
jgi:hypothetical protein